jgi:hypothetical protein
VPLLIFTATCATVVAPVELKAVAFSVCAPLLNDLVSKLQCHGPLISVLSCRPSRSNTTLLKPLPATSHRVESLSTPESVAPLAGCLKLTVGPLPLGGGVVVPPLLVFWMLMLVSSL